MGMHHGIIAARVTPDELLAALAPRLASATVVGEETDLDSIPDKAGDVGPLVANMHAGATYILDLSGLLAGDPDVIVDASRSLQTLVVDIGAETTSGTYWLVVADSGVLLRHHFNTLWGFTKPYDAGTPLPAEAEMPLEDIDGVGLHHVMRSLGFDYDGWVAKGRFAVVRGTFADGGGTTHGAALSAFARVHAKPDTGRVPTPVAVSRGGNGFDLVAAGSRLPDGTIVAEPEAPKRGLMGRLFGR